MVKSYYKGEDGCVFPFAQVQWADTTFDGKTTVVCVDGKSFSLPIDFMNAYTAWLDDQEAVAQETFNRGKRLLTKMENIKTAIYNISHQLEVLNSDIVEE